MSSRLLTAGEISLARQVYGEAIDYSKVKIYDQDYKWTFGLQSTNTIITPDGNIYYPEISEMLRADGQPNTVAIPDFFEATDSAQAIFIHEMAHVLQNQNGAWLMGSKVGDWVTGTDSYNYAEIFNGKVFHELTIEAQAEFLEDLYRKQNNVPLRDNKGKDAADYSNYSLEDYLAKVPMDLPQGNQNAGSLNYSIDTSYGSRDSGTEKVVYGEGVIFYSTLDEDLFDGIDTGFKAIIGHSFEKREYNNGDTFVGYEDSNTGSQMSLRINSDGISTLSYEDENGDSINQVFVSRNTLTSDQLARVNFLESSVETALGDGIKDYFQDSGDITYETLQANGANGVVWESTGMWPAITTEVEGEEYLLNELVHTIGNAAQQLSNFVTDQVDSAVEWFAADDGLQLDFANWFAGNVGDIIDGNLDADEALIDFAKYVALNRLGEEIQDILSVDDAQNVLGDALTGFGLDSEQAAVLASSIQQTFQRLAVEFVSNGFELSAEQAQNVAVGAVAANDNGFENLRQVV